VVGVGWVGKEDQEQDREKGQRSLQGPVPHRSS
jgi:hypothetical protein